MWILDYDDKNKKTADKPYLRVRSLVDIHQPLKKEKVKKSAGDWITCIFQYERLPSFCFICGLIGHINRHCEWFFQTPEEDIIRPWDVSVHAPNKRLSNLGGERWLKDGDDGSPLAVTRVTAAATLLAGKKETQNEKGNRQSLVDSNHFHTLRSNYGASKESINGALNDMQSSPNLEEGLEITEERK
ncbi:hypothetical protein L6452_02099 [Arctium lappa]|uniref:Uncharacterized protein n=1 Tax=Arctium lappa TaxID=4217 RepID=A0ACB9FJS1_ARCLA|nr:hypothetical protein L6452_02099 [Arctium lappa]